MTSEESPLPRFNELLLEAHGSSEAQDMFDLTDDPASRAEFDQLSRRYYDDAHKLIEFAAANRDGLIAALSELTP